jgi:hypothetical protein
MLASAFIENGQTNRKLTKRRHNMVTSHYILMAKGPHPNRSDIEQLGWIQVGPSSQTGRDLERLRSKAYSQQSKTPAQDQVEMFFTK